MLRKACLLSALATLAVAATVAVTQGQARQDILAVAAAFNQAREVCYAAPECPNLEEFMSLFTPGVRRTEIQRNNNVVLLRGLDELRADHLRVARSFPGRKLETTSMEVQGRNVVILQLNRDPGAAQPIPFVSVLRVEDGKIAHWILIAP